MTPERLRELPGLLRGLATAMEINHGGFAHNAVELRDAAQAITDLTAGCTDDDRKKLVGRLRAASTVRIIGESQQLFSELLAEAANQIEADGKRLEAAQPERKPVAWRVKDFADGWIIFQNPADAARYHEDTGALIEELYVRG
jgi:hypothetical protein